MKKKSSTVQKKKTTSTAYSKKIQYIDSLRPKKISITLKEHSKEPILEFWKSIQVIEAKIRKRHPHQILRRCNTLIH